MLGKHRIILLLLTARLVTGTTGDFLAYHTRLDEPDAVSGRYADLVIVIEDRGLVVFPFADGYRPRWENGVDVHQFEELIPLRSPNGVGFNRDHRLYSQVRLIEDDQNFIKVHWRYFPDLSNVEWDGVVDETFLFQPNGAVSRTIRRGTPRYQDWSNARNQQTLYYNLNDSGITSTGRGEVLSEVFGPHREIRYEMTDSTDQNYELVFHFDTGIGDSVREGRGKKYYEINGHMSNWKRGISRSALAFDGYYSSIEIDDIPGSIRTGSLTVQGWVALGAYPFGWAPIVQFGEWRRSGFYLGVNDEGYPGFHLAVNGTWYSVIHETRIDSFAWHQLVGTYDAELRMMYLYLDGQLVDEAKVPAGQRTDAASLWIGQNSHKMPNQLERVRIGNWPTQYGIEGLIDEVKLTGGALESAIIEEDYDKLLTTITTNPEVDLPDRRLPVNPMGKRAKSFAARYTHLKYHDLWDRMWRVSEHPDIVVDFDMLPTRLVMWRAFSYGPTLVTENGKWVGDQSSENYRELDDPSPAEGCCEHMSDKQCRHSHVRIIERTAARIVIHWRYALVDSRYLFVKSGHDKGDWADEYWTIYPDGVMVRHLARGMIWGDSWVETMFFNAPGTRPEDNVELEAYTLVNKRGESKTYSWADGSPDADLDDPMVAMVNVKSQYNTFNIYPTGSSVETFHGHSGRSSFHWWNHWPASQISSDGRGARAADRLSHSSLVWGIPSEPYLMYGCSKESAMSLLPLARSWNDPPPIRKTIGCEFQEYVQEERAYHLQVQGIDLSFGIKASDKRPLVNPCFILEHWQGEDLPEIRINGEKSTDIRSGLTRNTLGELRLVIWAELRSTTFTQFEISGSEE